MNLFKQDWDQIIRDFAEVKKEDSVSFGTILELAVYPFLKEKFGELEYIGRLDFKVKGENIYIEVKKRKYFNDEQRKAISLILAQDGEVYLTVFDKENINEKDILEVFDTILGSAYLIKLEKPPSEFLYRLYRIERFISLASSVIEIVTISQVSKKRNVTISDNFFNEILQIYESYVDRIIKKDSLRSEIKKDFRLYLEKFINLNGKEKEIIEISQNMAKVIEHNVWESVFSIIDSIESIFLDDPLISNEDRDLLKEIKEKFFEYLKILFLKK